MMFLLGLIGGGILGLLIMALAIAAKEERDAGGAKRDSKEDC